MEKNPQLQNGYHSNQAYSPSYDERKPSNASGYEQPETRSPNRDAEKRSSGTREWSIEMRPKGDQKSTVVIIGTGDLGRALLSCFVRAGYRVVMASRNPERNRSRIISIGGEVETIPEAVTQSHVILVAIPYEGFEGLDPNSLRDKVVVDVSNRPPDYDSEDETMAARLQRQLPQSKVVKAFNTLSAYTLQKGVSQGSKEVPVCSNDEEAKAIVNSLVRNIGFSPVDFGSLLNAKSIEDIPFAFFSSWKFPMIFAIIVWIFFFILILFRADLCNNFDRVMNDLDWTWKPFVYLPTSNVHQSFGFTSLTMLASCYFPGVIAAYLQLYRKTKYSEFPKWLDTWLKGRKELGLIALSCVFPHFILAILNVATTPNWILIWRDTVYFLCGMSSVCFMSILGVTSLPSVSATLTWKEFSFVQRNFGWLSLTFATLHLLFINGKVIVSNEFTCYFLPSASQLGGIFPVVTILLKLPLLLPCIDSRLQKIRRGS